jgi:acetolactate decarboxylase
MIVKVLSCSILLLSSCLNLKSQEVIKNKTIDRSVQIRGTMSKVMHEGDLSSTIDLDTISEKQYLCGLGALENMTGEILVLDGISYYSTIKEDQQMQVNESFSIKAPFFAYTHVQRWQEVVLSDSIFTLSQLENFMDQVTQKFTRPYFFRVITTVDSAQIHVLNLPKGTKINSPEDAHRGQKTFVIRDKEVDLVGFFSTQHQGIFTHHDTFLHLHLITHDRKQMGHLDSIAFKPGFTRLLLPRL